MSSRADYWNGKYIEYWEKKVKESNSNRSGNVTPGDVKAPGDDVAEKFFDHVIYNTGEKLLDYGCGFGRFYRFFKDRSVEYYGFDIASNVVKIAEKNYPELKGRLITAEGEELPYEDNTFDKVICYGVFDACIQEKALAEMLRICKVGGVILLTGKNDNYHDDDSMALVAETNARKKKHPNYFTDFNNMYRQILDFDNTIMYKEIFERRGDMGKSIFTNIVGDFFYEWRIIIKKQSGRNIVFKKLSDSYSKTWIRIHGRTDDI